MSRFSEAFALIVITAWVGGLWAIGYMAAPALFYSLNDRQLAGMLAGKMFTWIAYFGIGAGFFLLIHRLTHFGTHALKQSFFWAAFLMLLLTLTGHFGVQPLLAQLKAQALPADVMQSVFADRFRTWHGVASIAFMVQSLLGIILVLKAKQ